MIFLLSKKVGLHSKSDDYNKDDECGEGEKPLPCSIGKNESILYRLQQA